MMSTQDIHKAQISILHTLRHSPYARYTTLMRPTRMESDVFKFHLRKLIHQKHVRKLASGMYELTPQGKECANNLDKTHPSVLKQPKLSVAIIVSKDSGAKKLYLFQQRLRSPFYGYWGCLSGPVQWGETIETAATRELKKQTSLSAVFKVQGFYRKSDYDHERNTLLEDKLFAIVEGTDIKGDLSNKWSKGSNAWMSVTSLKKQEKYFASTCDFTDMLQSDEPYRAQKAFYKQDDY